MGANSKLKLKPFYIMKILMEQTDEQHPITVNELIEELRKYEISAERKSIYADIEMLMEFGLDIICQKGRANQYFIGVRDFELPELKLLVDAVQSSRFITYKKSEELIGKLEKLTSVHEAQELHRHVVISDQIKTMNESIYYNVNDINKAIQENKQIRFKYFDYNLDKQVEYRRNGEWYYASPYAFTWDDDNYYMIAFYERYEDISNFRVDRMTSIEVIDEDRVFEGECQAFNVADYSKKIFRMFSGDTEKVKIQFDNSLINVVIDRFGKEVEIQKVDQDAFVIEVDVVATNTFLSWLFMFGDKVKIVEPESLKEEMISTIMKITHIY
ncbi:WYL domain-containing transcriptional regulator [Alkaliphilus pronyensis]|uniref:WYL domain-containing transcriptional regulator n=1 Tax=Alkaliphilus pronyensis TaxID=1482732 RepID=A0A6I0FJH9_9FIRM|nr:WYL domain-containing protein [Alkaliphilus pronyensis]KAB3536271.1 WYL domain-containing transcriptional regulator [Alkaliphilus pronyensis]